MTKKNKTVLPALCMNSINKHKMLMFNLSKN